MTQLADSDLARVIGVVSAAWADVLALEAPSPADDFFKLGGDSLSATTLVAQIEDALGVCLEPVKVFELPRLEDFARMVAESLTQDVEQGAL